MKTLIALTVLALVSCTVPGSWEGTPNPLDTPATRTRTPIAEGRFGHSNKGITW